MPVKIRMAESEQDAVLVFKAFQMMHAGGTVPGPIDNLKTLTNVIRLVKGPRSCVLMAMAGDELAGICGLIQDVYWWNHDEFLTDKGLFVLPKYENGGTFQALIKAAQQAGDDLGIPVYLTINNGRRKRGAGSKWERIGATLGYTNRGAILAHFQKD